jgi:DNA-binding NarL/FixJ family response regulator
MTTAPGPFDSAASNAPIGSATSTGAAVSVDVPSPAIRIVVADDHAVVRAGYAGLLATQADFAVVGTACDGAEAVRVCRKELPDVVLMDVRMPVMDGIQATTELLAPDPLTADPPTPGPLTSDPLTAGPFPAKVVGPEAPRVLILTTFDLDEHVYDALAAGASGFLLKDVTAERLFEAVRVVAAGEALLAPAITRRLIAEFARLKPRTPAVTTLAALTPRETEVLRLLAEGLSNPEIAARLHVGEETVKTHVSRVLTKLGLRDRTQAVVMAYETGLVVPRSGSPA